MRFMIRLLSGLFAAAAIAACSSSPADVAASAGNINTPLCGTAPAGTAVAAPLTACPAGFADCDHDSSNGCEANVDTDVNRCGSCAHTCGAANGVPTCTGGVCSIACDAGFADCNGENADGCEVHITVDPGHCGACGNACSGNNAVPSCNAGACALTCNPGFGDCDGIEANGCETDTQTSLGDCGACGNVCVSFNGTGSCHAGACTLACMPGFGDCDGNPHNGCETDTQTSPANCGACGNACNGINGAATCNAGTCTLHCDQGFADCDKNAANGCEADFATDLGNCGSCGNVCGSENGIATCTSGACTLQCSSGYGNCDGLFSNGCERSLTTDSANCGTCGNVCAQGTSCVNGVCQ